MGINRALTVYYDAETGEVQRWDWGEKFSEESSLMRADVLADIERACAEEAEDSLRRFLAELPTDG